MERIRKGDAIVVIAGKDKGKRSTILNVRTADGAVLAEHVAVAIHHVKPRKQGEKGTVKQRESYIQACKVMPVCPSCHKPCRMNTGLLDSGKRVRKCNHCKETF